MLLKVSVSYNNDEPRKGIGSMDVQPRPQKARRAKLTNINLPRAAKTISFCCSLKEILDQQLIIRNRVVTTFSAIAKDLACAPHAARGPHAVQAWSNQFCNSDDMIHKRADLFRWS